MTDEALPTPDLTKLRIAREDSGRPRRPLNIGRWIMLLVIFGGGYYAWKERDSWLPVRKDPDDKSREGIVREIDTSEGTVTASANGYVIARKKAALSTVISGRMVDLRVEEGSIVKAGDIVARLQFDDYEVAVREAEADVSMAAAEVESMKSMLAMTNAQKLEAENATEVASGNIAEAVVEADNARREMERQKATKENSGDMSESEWDRAKSASDAADARLATTKIRLNGAQAALATAVALIQHRSTEIVRLEAAKKRADTRVDSAKILLAKTFVIAPFDGVIIRKDAEEGEVVASTGFGANSRGSVATLVDMATLEVQVELSEELLGSIRENSPAFVTLDAQSERRWPALVRQIWPTADRQKGTIELRIQFRERPATLRPDMGVRVDFPEQAESRPVAGQKLLVLAASAVRGDGENRFVFRIDGEHVKKTEVRVGERRGGDFVIVGGLQKGARVVIDAPESMRDGDGWKNAVKESR